MKVEKIDHIAIQVRDLEKATRFFSDLFGLKFSEPFGPEDEDVIQVMDSLGINLLAPKTPDGPVSKLIERRGEGRAERGGGVWGKWGK